MGQDNSKRKSASRHTASVTGESKIGFYPPNAEPAKPKAANEYDIHKHFHAQREAALRAKEQEGAKQRLSPLNDNGADVDPQADLSASMLSHQQQNQLPSDNSQANDMQDTKNKGEVCHDLDRKLLKKLSWWRWLLSAVTWRLAFWFRERPKTLEADNEIEANERIERFKAHLYWARIDSFRKQEVRNQLCLMNSMKSLDGVKPNTIRRCEAALRLPHDDHTLLSTSHERSRNGPNGMR